MRNLIPSNDPAIAPGSAIGRQTFGLIFWQKTGFLRHCSPTGFRAVVSLLEREFTPSAVQTIGDAVWLQFDHDPDKLVFLTLKQVQGTRRLLYGEAHTAYTDPEFHLRALQLVSRAAHHLGCRFFVDDATGYLVHRDKPRLAQYMQDYKNPKGAPAMPNLRSMTAVYLRRGERFLFLHRAGGRVAANTFIGSAGGHFEPHELNDPRACLLRELAEELAVTEEMIAGLTLRYITLRAVDGEVRQNYYFFADLLREPEGGLRSTEGSLHWLSLADALPLKMPFTAAHMLRHYAETGRFDCTLYGGIATADSVVFTPMGVAEM